MSSGARKWRVQSSRSGMPTAVANGRILHSQFDPVREAEKAAATVPDGVGIVVLGGLGLGYVAEAIHGHHRHCHLIIAEADAEAVSQATEIRNLSHLFKQPDVSIFVGGSPHAIQNILAEHPVGSTIHYLPWRPAVQNAPEWYIELENAIAQTAERRAVNSRTLERFGNLWVRNLAANRNVIERALSLDDWCNSFANVPALVIAAGPSLEEMLPDIDAIRRRFLLLSTDTAVTALIRENCQPDVIAAVDPQYWNTRHLDWSIKGVGDALVLAEAATHPAIFRILTGRPLLTRSRFPLGTIFEDAAELKGELKAGGSVATAAWDLARHLGCSPIAAVGLDLGFPNGRTHYGGSLSRILPLHNSHRCSPAEGQFYQSLHNAQCYWTQDMAQRPLQTDRRMDIYHAWFAESIMALGRNRSIIVGDTGRFIDGAHVVQVKQLLNYPEIRHIIDKKLHQLKSHPINTNVPIRLDAAVHTLTKNLTRVQTLAAQGKKAAGQAAEAMRKGQDAALFLKNMQDVDAEILKGQDLNVLSFLIQPIILEINEGEANGDPINTSYRLYCDIEESAIYHLDCLKRTF